MDMDMDTGAERREKLKLLLKLQLLLILMLRLIPGMDIMDTMDLDMVHTMHTLIMDMGMDTGAERREKLKLLLKLQLLLILMLRLIPGMDTMVDTMDIDTMVILMVDSTGVNEEQDCNICKHLYTCTYKVNQGCCKTHLNDVLTTTTCAHSLSFQAVPSCSMLFKESEDIGTD